MQAWISNEINDSKVIIFTDQIIYKANPKVDDPAKLVSDFQLNSISKELVSTPLSYISEIRLNENNKFIELLVAKDFSVDLKVADDKTRQEIFDYFKSNIPNSNYSVEKFSVIKAGKKPMIAFFVALLFFLWTLFIALGMESGSDYDVTGKKYFSLAGIVLALASLGVKNVVLIFGSLLLISAFSFYKKARKPPVIHRITWPRK
jgi:hypothetical protein